MQREQHEETEQLSMFFLSEMVFKTFNILKSMTPTKTEPSRPPPEWAEWHCFVFRRTWSDLNFLVHFLIFKEATNHQKPGLHLDKEQSPAEFGWILI